MLKQIFLYSFEWGGGTIRNERNTFSTLFKFPDDGRPSKKRGRKLLSKKERNPGETARGKQGTRHTTPAVVVAEVGVVVGKRKRDPESWKREGEEAEEEGQ